jgi:hypothetical protein
MPLMDTVRGWFGGESDMGKPISMTNPHAERYDRLMARYEGRATAREWQALMALDLENPPDEPGLRPLRSPGHRVGEFYAGKLWGGGVDQAFALRKADAGVEKAVARFFEWSNWERVKQPAARQFAVMGDLFLRVATNPDQTRVYMERVDPRHVTQVRTDERGNLTFVRVDVPKVRNLPDGRVREYVRTEEWRKGDSPAGRDGSMRAWDSDEPDTVTKRRLSSDQSDDSVGTDFIPFVHAKFKDVGRPDGRGVGAFEHAEKKMDELDLLARKLHALLFPDWVWVFEQTATGPDGELLPPAKFEVDVPGEESNVHEVNVGGQTSLRLPTGVKAVPAIPAIDFQAHINAINEYVQEIEADLPELRYHRINETTDGRSGRAIRFQLGDLVDKATEARTSGMSAVERAVQMALTIGKNAGIEEFEGLPEFGDEERKIEFVGVDPFPITEVEELQGLDARLALYERAIRVGTHEEALEYAGIPDGTLSGAPQEAQGSDLQAAAGQLAGRFGGQGSAPVGSPTPAPRTPPQGQPTPPPSGEASTVGRGFLNRE